MYLVRKKNAKTAHIWTGYDTACRMYSTGGLQKKAYAVVNESDLPACSMCVDKKPLLPGETPAMKFKSLPVWERAGKARFSETAVNAAIEEKFNG